MAGDLIPPPSPAGRPRRGGQDALPLREREWAAPPERASREPSPRETALEAGAREEPPPRLPRDSPYRSRFGLLFGALLGVGIAAAVALVLLVGGGGERGAPAWSDWRPSTSSLAAAEQIAEHIGRKYRLDNENQIVAVDAKAGRLEVNGLELTVAIRTAPVGGDIELVEGDPVLYTLNGLGPAGSIKGVKLSSARELFVRREALELALHTFRYVDDADLVVALLPPAPPQETAGGATPRPVVQALFYRREDLEPQLAVPLDATLAQHTPRADEMAAREMQTVEALTRPNVFRATITQAQDTRLVLVLDGRGA